jgi:hypothetical protein
MVDKPSIKPSATPELPAVTMLTSEEVSQAVAHFAARKQFGIDPEARPVKFKVSYRQVKGELFASIVITDIASIAPEKSNAQ